MNTHQLPINVIMIASLSLGLTQTATAQNNGKGPPTIDTNVVNTPDVNVINETLDVNLTNPVIQIEIDEPGSRCSEVGRPNHNEIPNKTVLSYTLFPDWLP